MTKTVSMVRQKVAAEQGKRHRDLVSMLDSLPSSANASTFSADAESRSRANSLGTEDDEGDTEAGRGHAAVTAAEQLLAGIASLKVYPEHDCALAPATETKEG